jgi:hypothetical protein
MRLWIACSLASVAAFASDVPASNVTFNKDVLPVLQANCQSCHRPGQIAPMSFLTYESTRPWAKAIKVAVLSKKMPPWFADPSVGHFANDRTLKPHDVEVLTKWADSGSPLGNPQDAPTAIKWPENGWQIKPDYIAQGNTFTVAAHPPHDVIEWMTVTMPTGFTKDTWVTSIEIKPSDPEVTHHICMSFRPHADGVKYDVPTWTDKPRDESGSALPRTAAQIAANPRVAGAADSDDARRRETAANPGETGGCYVPGVGAFDYRPYQSARLIKAGTDMVFSLHYTPNGKETKTHTEVGFTIAQQEPNRRYVYLASSSPADADHFAIPPNDPNWLSPPAEATFVEDAELVWMMPHMHVRGKDMSYKLIFPDGKEQMILNVPHYDFNWQLGYAVEAPIKVPKGTKLVGIAHFDNSANNKFNPDPNRTVYYGDMTWEEMMMPFFAVTVDKAIAPSKILKRGALVRDGA